MEISKIVTICRNVECIDCPIYDVELCECMVEHIPQAWNSEEIERRLKKYGKEKTDRS